VKVFAKACVITTHIQRLVQRRVSSMGISYLLIVVGLLLLCVSESTSSTTAPVVLQYLQSESGALSSAQQTIHSFLQSKRIPVGGIPRSLCKSGEGSQTKLRIALSTKLNNLECRIALGRAPLGRVCVSPCGCTGSQQWIQFSELNRLRRKEPSQWTKCQTCQQAFDYSIISTHGGVTGNAVSLLLDNVKYLRASIVIATLILGYAASANMLVMRFLTSRWFWQQYPKWVKIVNLPLVLKFWGGKLAAQYLYGIYLKGETHLLEMLAELETNIIEPRLPAENAVDQKEKDGNDDDDYDDDVEALQEGEDDV